MLKWSSEEDVNEFSAKICSLFNPKYVGNQQEKDALMEIDFATAYSFARNCELTAEEYFLAFNLAAEGKLKYEQDKDGNAESIKLFREVDAIKLNEIKSAYIRYKNEDKVYENYKTQIRNFLNPPPPEMTKEELQKTTIENIRKDYHRFKADGKVMATPIFYDLIVFARGGGKVKLEFVENFLKNYVPEVVEGKIGSNGTSLPKVIKKDVFVEFQNEMISNYVQYLKLSETSEELWIQHWERLLNLKNSGNEKKSNTNNIAG